MFCGAAFGCVALASRLALETAVGLGIACCSTARRVDCAHAGDVVGVQLAALLSTAGGEPHHRGGHVGVGQSERVTDLVGENGGQVGCFSVRCIGGEEKAVGIRRRTEVQLGVCIADGTGIRGK